MTRTSKFAFVTFTAIAATLLAPTGAFAHGGGGGGFGGGGFGGGGFGGGHAGGFSAPAAHSFVTFSGSGGYPRLPVASGHSIERSSITARKPVESTGHHIPTIAQIAKDPRRPLPPNPIQTPNHNKGWGGGAVIVPLDTADCSVVDGVVSVDGQVVQTVQTDCSCLARQVLEDGRVVLQDVCSRDTVIATPAGVR